MMASFITRVLWRCGGVRADGLQASLGRCCKIRGVAGSLQLEIGQGSDWERRPLDLTGREQASLHVVVEM